MVVFKALFSKVGHSQISPSYDSRTLATLELITVSLNIAFCMLMILA